MKGKKEKDGIKIQEVIIGTILVNPNLYFEVSDYLQACLFSSVRLMVVADSLFAEINGKGTINTNSFAYSLSNESKDEEIDYAFIIGLIKFSDSVSFIGLCEQLKEKYLNDNEIIIHTKAIKRLESGVSYSEVIPDEEGERQMLIDSVEVQKDNRIKDIQSAHDSILEAMESKGGLTGISTGFKELNNITAGWQPTDLIIIAARPGMGKTTLACNYCLTAALEKIPVAFFSLEMSKKQIYQKFVSIITGVPTDRMRSGKIDESEASKIEDAFALIHTLPLYVYSGISNIHKIKNKLRVLKRKYGIELCAIDYIQLANCGKSNQNPIEKVGEISNNLKTVASETDCNLCMLGLSQLSRDVEKRGGDKRPVLSDLRQSGEIEQDADMVQFVWRGEYYNVLQDEDGNDLKNKAEIIIEKNRHGMLGTVKTGFNGSFYELKDDNYNEIESNLIPRPSKIDDDYIPF